MSATRLSPSQRSVSEREHLAVHLPPVFLSCPGLQVTFHSPSCFIPPLVSFLRTSFLHIFHLSSWFHSRGLVDNGVFTLPFPLVTRPVLLFSIFHHVRSLSAALLVRSIW